MLEFIFTKMTGTSLVRNFIPCGLWHLNALFGNGLKNYNLIFLKVTYVSEFRRLESKLFHSIIVDGKKEFLKVMIGFKQWNIGAVPSSVRRVPSRSSIE